MTLTRHDEDIPVLVPVVGPVARGAISDGEARSLVADQLETVKMLLHVTKIWDKILTFSVLLSMMMHLIDRDLNVVFYFAKCNISISIN